MYANAVECYATVVLYSILCYSQIAIPQKPNRIISDI